VGRHNFARDHRGRQIFDYSVEDEVVGGMKKLGLDPAASTFLTCTA